MEKLHEILQSMIVMSQLVDDYRLNTYDNSRHFLTLFKGSHRRIIDIARCNINELFISIQVPTKEKDLYDSIISAINDIDKNRYRLICQEEGKYKHDYNKISFVLLPGNKIRTSRFISTLYKD